MSLNRRRAGHVLLLELNAPKTRNALSRPLLRDLATALLSPEGEVTGIVISGGPQWFSAGADFGELTGTAADIAYDDAVAEVTAAIAASTRPVIAALEGPCVGAAADIALSCDVRVAGEGSYLQVPAVRLGLMYNPEAVARLWRRYSGDAVRRLLLLGEPLAAAEALEAGLVSLLAPSGEAAKRATALLADIEPAHMPAMAATRRLLTDLDAGTRDETGWQERRRALLDSDARRAAIAGAKRRHTDNER